MDKDSTAKKLVSTAQTSPEEDTVLLAIEALEARSVDPDPEPWSPSPRPNQVIATESKELPKESPKESSKESSTADVTIVSHSLPTTVRSAKTAKPTQAKSEPQQTVKTKPEVRVVVPVAPVVPPKPKKPATPAEEMAEELANAPAMSYFQFFWHQNKPRKPFVVIGVAVIVIGLAAGAYFATR